MVDLEFVEIFPTYVSLQDLKATPELAEMKVVQRGMRLSVQPVEKRHFELVKQMGDSRL